MKGYLAASRRAQRFVSWTKALGFLFVVGMIFLWQSGYDLDQAGLKAKSLFVSIHVEPKMMKIEGGIFQQGDAHGRYFSDVVPTRNVMIKPFAMGVYEVTFEEYDRFAIATGNSLPPDQGWGRGARPVINVSWGDARAYAKWLSQATSKRYRLPTESIWEYAARAGGKDDSWAGTSDESQLKSYAVYGSKKTEPAGNSRKPNGFGLYDMSGNVWEWLEDCWDESYPFAPKDGLEWIGEGENSCDQRAIRGGSFDNRANSLRVSFRNWSGVSNRSNVLGFRLVLDIEG